MENFKKVKKKYLRTECLFLNIEKFYQVFPSSQYQNVYKFWDRQVLVNTVDPDQTAPKSTLFAILFLPFGPITIKLLNIRTPKKLL